ncbi:hypothetical protein [Vibrio alginolyticus]|uniref:hypothetical protein n=1 Tax=Vibrio alginolyticus TaxID=663 RepID=UPI003754DD39
MIYPKLNRIWRLICPLVFVSLVSIPKPSIAAKKTTLPFVEGMIVDMGGVLSGIELRAKSLGPGMCVITFSIDKDRLLISAPPLKWSKWETITTGQNSYRITSEKGCDTGFIAEVRY